MNMKKTLYLVLAICILLASVPMVGFAQGTTDAEQAAAGKVCKIGDVYYDTLHAALKAVQDGETISLISDLTQKDRFVESGNASVVSSGITFTLNGNGHTVTRPAKDTSGALFGDVSGNFLFENCRFDLQGDWGGGQLFRALKPTEAMTITFRDCDVKLNNALVGEPLDAGRKLELSFINTTVTQSAKRSNGFLPDFNSGQDVTVTLDHSTLNLMAGKLWTTHNAVGRLILKNGSHLNTLGGVTPITCWGDAGENNRQSIELYDSEIRMSDESEYRAKDYSALLNWTGGFMSLKLDGKSAIRTNRTNAATGQTKGMYLVRVNVNTNMTVELEKGAVIEMNDCGVKDKTKLVWWQGDAKINLIDKGAEWKFGASIQKCGVMMNLPWGARQLGWASADDTRLYSNDNLLSVADATEPLTLKIANYSETDFGNKAGASIRLTDPLGIRFTVNVSSALTAALAGYAGTTVTFGAILAPTAKVTGAFTQEGVGEGNYVITDPAAFRWAVENVDGMNEYRVALVGIPATKSALEMQFSATGFFTVKYADGSTRTFYAAFDQTANSRSLYEVAQAAQAAGITGDAITQILNICQAGNQ